MVKGGNSKQINKGTNNFNYQVPQCSTQSFRDEAETEVATEEIEECSPLGKSILEKKLIRRKECSVSSLHSAC